MIGFTCWRLGLALKRDWGNAWINEAGCLSVQVGPLCVEVIYGPM